MRWVSRGSVNVARVACLVADPEFHGPRRRSGYVARDALVVEHRQVDTLPLDGTPRRALVYYTLS